MARESVAEKGRRYLVEGRLTISQLDALSIEASCRGGGALYELGHNGAAWWCSCPALGRCAHLVALQLVAVRAGAGVEEDPEPEVRSLASTSAEFEDEDLEPEVGL
jgi:uncharacterized Zn finger protein